MARACFVIKLRPGSEAEYRRRHNEIWPELVKAIREAGIREFALFLRGTDVFAFAECDPDCETAFRKLGKTEVDVAWSRWFEDLIEEETDETGNLLYAEEVWHLEPERASG